MPLGPAARVYEYAVSHSPLKETPARQRWAKALRIADPCRASPNPLAVAYIQGSRSLVHTLHVNDLATQLSLISRPRLTQEPVPLAGRKCGNARAG